MLGARPVLGGGLIQERDEVGPAVVVLSHAFWHAAFGGDPAVVGRHISVQGLDCTVAGVMPEGFSGHSPTGVDLFAPLSVAMHSSPGWDRDQYRNLLAIVVRVPQDETVTAAETQAQNALGYRIGLSPIVGADVGATEQRVAWWLTGVSLLILVIGLANASTLLVVRAAKRIQDVVIRTALGASRGRLVAQGVLEAVLVAAAATAFSLGFATWLDEPIRRVLFPNLIGRSELARSTLMAAGIAGALALVVAVIANIWQVRAQVQAASVAGAARRSGRTKTMTGLLLVQTALSMVLLAGAGMFGQSLYKLAAQDFGMRMAGVAVVEFEQGPNIENKNQILGGVLEQVRALPGVETATVIDTVPFTGFNVPPISVPGMTEPPKVGGQLPFLIASTPELLKILDVKIVEGRGFTAADDRGPLVVIVNQTMARLVWPGESAVGKCIRIGFDPDFDPEFSVGPPTPSAKVPCREVIGVARDTRQRSVVPMDNEAHLMQYFVPFSQEPMPPFLPQGPHVRGLMLRTIDERRGVGAADPTARRRAADGLAVRARRAVRADARSTTAAVAVGDDAARALQRARAWRGGSRAVRVVRARRRRTPPRDGDPARDRRAAERPGGSRPPRGADDGRGWRRRRRCDGHRGWPLDSVAALRNHAVRPARARLGGRADAHRRRGRDAAAGTNGVKSRSERPAAGMTERTPGVVLRFA